MGGKLKTFTATRVSGGGSAPVVYSPLEYVPAAVAQGLLEALIRLRNATERMMRGKPTVMDEAISEADAAIAAATKGE